MEDLYIFNLLALLLVACGATITIVIRSYHKSIK